jgi:hypothetical protein
VTNLLFDAGEHDEAAALTAQFIPNYLASVASRPVFPKLDRQAMRSLINAPLPSKPATLQALYLVAPADDGNRSLLRRLVESGSAFLVPASVKSRFAIRACFMNLQTQVSDIEAIMADILRLANDERHD